MRQWHEHLAAPALLLPHVIGDDRDAPREPVLIPQPLMDPLGRMALLLQPASVVLQDLVDDRNERIELWTGWRLRSPITRWHRVLQDLCNRLPVDPEHPRRFALAHSLDVTRTAHPVVKLHEIHLPALSLFASGPRCGLLLRDGQIIRPIPLSILSPGFTRGPSWPDAPTAAGPVRCLECQPPRHRTRQCAAGPRQRSSRRRRAFGTTPSRSNTSFSLRRACAQQWATRIGSPPFRDGRVRRL